MKKEAAQLKKEAFEDFFEDNRCGRYQRFLWDLFEKPHTSIAAKVGINLKHFLWNLLSFITRSVTTTSGDGSKGILKYDGLRVNEVSLSTSYHSEIFIL